MLRTAVRCVGRACGRDGDEVWHGLLRLSLAAAARENGWDAMLARLRAIEPDIVPPGIGDGPALRGHWELKRRMLHAFQCGLMLRALEGLPGPRVTVVDIGASGVHMRYLERLAPPGLDLETIGVNIAPGEVDRMRRRGQRAVLCRGEEVHRVLAGTPVDMFTVFETAEHLHNPACFFRRLSARFPARRLVMTVPYVRRSRVGLFNVRQGFPHSVTACDEHIFELSPEDWALLLLHSGWRVSYDAVSRQYPARLPLVREAFARVWRTAEFEGFWGAVLEKDTSFADRYLDWEE